MKLELNQLTKSFHGLTAVDHLNYTFTEGVYGLLGVNGAGKTTIMRMICTLLTPSEGTITIDGQSVFEMGPEYRKILGYLPQEFGYYPEFTVEDYLRYIASIKGLRTVAAKKRTEELLYKVGLSDMQKKKMNKLSGGMKRRVGIAQALMNDPAILILDEPTAGLDPNERVRFRNLISELSEDRIVLLSTHIVSDVEYIAKEILLLKEGVIKTSGNVDDLIASMPGSVWECEVRHDEAEIITTKNKVANIRNLHGKVGLRVISEMPPSENAVKVPATMEDVFLCFFGEASEKIQGIY